MIGTWRVAPDRDQDLLAERARLLAAPVTPDRPSGSRKLLVATVGQERVGIDLPAVREVLPPNPVSALPRRAGSLLVGLRSVRGELIVLADLAAILGSTSQSSPDEAWVILVGEEDPVGLLADRAEDIVDLAGEEAGPVHEPRAEIVSLIASSGLVVLNVSAVLRDPRLRILAGQADAAGTEGAP